MINDSVNLTEMGNRIKELRKKQNKTQKYFADMLYISPSYLALIEKGRRTATIDVLSQISKVCNVTTDYLLFGNILNKTDDNFKTFERLSQKNSPEKVRRALRLADYYLSLEDPSEQSNIF